MFILKKGHQPGVYVPLRPLFLVFMPGYAENREIQNKLGIPTIFYRKFCSFTLK